MKQPFANNITELFGIQYPIIQGGMVWCSGWQLAAAVSNAGGLGLIGAGSMPADTLRIHLRKCKAATDKPFGVNVPLLYSQVETTLQLLVEENVKIVFTSAGSPKTWTSWLKEQGMTVVHVVSSVKFAKKSQEAGVDAVVAEGFEAGGHNGREETTTLCLLPAVRDAISVPLLAAGGIADGRAMLAAFALGADGVQVGSRFAASIESSAHQNFKQQIIATHEGDTELVMKQLTPVRLIKNEFYETIKAAELRGTSTEELQNILGKGRSKKGMFEGDMQEGELEIGQVALQIKDILPAATIVENIWQEFWQQKQALCNLGTYK
jgi:enoyl-[acyl-carrier protein] reductase II